MADNFFSLFSRADVTRFQMFSNLGSAAVLSDFSRSRLGARKPTGNILAGSLRFSGRRKSSKLLSEKSFLSDGHD